jgi:hypothetical protein
MIPQMMAYAADAIDGRKCRYAGAFAKQDPIHQGYLQLSQINEPFTP